MQWSNIPRFMLAAAASGSGKTTVTCGLLQALQNRGCKVASFKCGPDYIDPMFHQKVIGTHSRNLDLFFMQPDVIHYLLAKNGAGKDVSLLEGVMGFYDGLGGNTTIASSYDLAKTTKTPVILVVNCNGMSVSAAAQIKGFLSFRPDAGIVGVILNQVSAMLYPTLKSVIEAELSVRVLGYLPYLPECFLESRHLGLVTAQEITDLQKKLQQLAAQLEKSVDIDGLLQIAGAAAPIGWQEPGVFQQKIEQPVKIAIAQDEAFCFYYQDSLDLLAELGAELLPFSPLHDEMLPDDIDGLYLGGGYPELYGRQLAANTSIKEQLQTMIQQGIPCLAECGGFMYLQESLEAMDGQHYPMVGAISGKAYRTTKLQRFGYITLTAEEDNMLCQKDESIPAHEFHYWDSTNCGAGFLAEKANKKRNWHCIVTGKNLFAGYPHFHFYGEPQFAVNFIRACQAYQFKK